MVDISRSKVSGLPLITLLAINGLLNKYQMLGKMKKGWRALDGIREQLLAFPEHHGVDVSSFPQLSLNDFWSM